VPVVIRAYYVSKLEETVPVFLTRLLSFTYIHMYTSKRDLQ
jgi:hypothetical protein